LEFTASLTKLNRYQGGIAKFNGNFYHVQESGGVGDKWVTIIANAKPAMPVKVVDRGLQLWEDDYTNVSQPDLLGTVMQGTITASAAVPGMANQFKVTTNITISAENVAAADRFKDGLLRANKNYTIISYTPGANVEFTVEAAAAPPNNGTVWVYAKLGAGNPALYYSNAAANANAAYDMLQVSTIRTKNPFADAYIQPELNELDAYDTADVTPMSHLSDDQFVPLTESFRGATPARNGNPAVAQPMNYETSLFWSVNTLVAYQGSRAEDGDVGKWLQGFTDENGKSSVLYLETARDALAASASKATYTLGGRLFKDMASGMTTAKLNALVMAHEVAHQFLKDNMPPPPVGDGEGHRVDGANLMDSSPSTVPADKLFFHPEEVRKLRRQEGSP
jgi:hypothetical protein